MHKTFIVITQEAKKLDAKHLPVLRRYLQNNTDICLIPNIQCISYTLICENHIKPVGIFGNYLSKCPDIKRNRRPISLQTVPPCQRYKVKTYFSSVGLPCSKFPHLNKTLQNQI